MRIAQPVETDFVNLVKITEVKDVDYIIHLFNSYSGKAYVFKIYKDLWDKAMEIRTIEDLDITVTDDKEKEKEKQEQEEEKIASIFT